MEFLSRATIRVKLVAGFTIALGLVVAVGMFGIFQIHSINDVSRELRQVWLPKIEILGKIQGDIAAHRLLATRRMQTRNFRELAVISSGMEKVVSRLRAYNGTYATLVGAVEERRLFSDFLALWEGYGNNLTAALRQLEAGEISAGLEQFNTNGIATFDLAAEKLDALAALAKEGSSVAAAHAQRVSDVAITLTLAVIALAAVATAAAMLWIARAVSAPILRITEAMRRLTAGDDTTTVDESPGRTDEIGVLAKAVAGYRDAMVLGRLRGEEAKRAALAAEAAHSRLREAFEVVPEGLVLLDADDRLVLWNHRYAEIFAESADVIAVGARFEDVLRAGLARGQYPDAVGHEETWLAERLAQHVGSQSEREQRLSGGRWIRIHERRTADGGSIGVRVDITELKQRQEELRAQKLRFEMALTSMSQGVCVFDAEQRLVICNKPYLHMYHMHDDDVRVGMSLREILEKRATRMCIDRDALSDYVEQRLAVAAEKRPATTIHRLPDGRVIELGHHPIAGGGWVATHEDITERERLHAELANQNVLLRQREEELGERNEQLDAALENMLQGLAMFDADNRLVVCNKRFAEMYGLTAEQVKPGTSAEKIFEYRIASGQYHLKDTERFIGSWTSPFGEASKRTQELADGRIISVSRRRTPDGGRVVMHEDITEQRRTEARIAHMAHHDALTDLANRVLFRERLAETLQHSSDEGQVAVLCMDLDRFKEVNDTLGHPIGDALLLAVAGRLRSCARETDLVARIGGDEFAILQTAAGQPVAAAELGRRIVETIGAPYELDGHHIVLGASVGIAVSPNDGVEPDRLLKNADLALYRAKNDGRGKYRFFEPEMDARAQARRKLELDLRAALAGGDFELHYQPLLDLDSNEVTTFEALLRWNHPERGRVSPGEFIPLAEETGLIVPIGEWVLRRACAEAANWPKDVKVAVNLSALQFRASNLLDLVFSALAAAGIAPHRLELEITESVFLEHTEAAFATLQKLRALGVQIALDDFGTGYSSLSYLRRFPFDKIKIDQSFIQGMNNDAQSHAIIEAIVGLGANLNMTTVAEGVETRDQLEGVRAHGCAEVQGYYLSPPRPAGELPSLLKALRQRIRLVPAVTDWRNSA